MNEPDAAFLVDGRLGDRGFDALVGQSGTGKTFVALDLAFCVATGTPWLGASIARRGPVVFIAAEGWTGVKARVLAWKLEHGYDLAEPLGVHFYRGAVDFNVQPILFMRDVEPVEPVLIIGDPMTRCLGPGADENDTKAMSALVRATDQVRDRFGCVFLWNHHTGWDGKRERGASAFRGAADVTMLLSKSSTGLTLTCEKARHTASFPPLNVRLVPMHGSCIVRRTLGRVDGKAGAVLAVLGTGPLTKPEWLTAAGLPKTTFYRCLKELEAAGLVHLHRGVYSAVADD